MGLHKFLHLNNYDDIYGFIPPRILPPGWEAVHPSSGRTYYMNHNTQKTTWKKPKPVITEVNTNNNGPKIRFRCSRHSHTIFEALNCLRNMPNGNEYLWELTWETFPN